MGLEHYLSIFTKAVFIENMVLAYFLGLCSFLAISKKIDSSIGIGMAVVVVLTVTTPINWFILHGGNLCIPEPYTKSYQICF